MTRIDLGGGKYSVIHNNGTELLALRYGEPWRNCCGDGLILALVQEIETLREQIATVKPTGQKGEVS
jgi:hypothetical protein